MASGFEYNCDYCRIPFGRDKHIQCATCHDIRLCLTCFSYGKELPPHKSNHPFYVIEFISKSIFEDAPSRVQWSGHEEILLLDGIENYGLGNWKKIAAHIGSLKTPAQAEAHYLQTYCAASPSDMLEGYNRNDTDHAHGDENTNKTPTDSIDADVADDDEEVEEEEYVSPYAKQQQLQRQQRQQQRIANRNNVKFGAVNLDYYGDKARSTYLLNNTSVFQMVQYSPFRHEFEAEWEDNAESLIAELGERDLHDPATSEMAMRQLAHYNLVLRIRRYVKSFILDRRLVLLQDHKARRTPKYRKQRDGQKSVQEQWPVIKKQLMPKLAPFMKYFGTTQEFIDFMDTAVIIHAHWDGIELYLQHRRAGCRSIRDANKRLTNNAGLYSHAHSPQDSTRHTRSTRYATRHTTQQNKRNGIRGRRKFIGGDSDSDNDNECGGYASLLNPVASMTPMNGDDDDDEEDGFIAVQHRSNKKFKLRAEPQFKKQKLCTQALAAVDDKFMEQMMPVRSEHDHDHHLSDPLLSPPAAMASGLDRDNIPLPSYLLLSKPENDFISYCRLLPSQYMQYKDVIIMSNMLHGCLNLNELNTLLPHLSVDRIAEFCDFFQRMGWIRISGEA